MYGRELHEVTMLSIGITKWKTTCFQLNFLMPNLKNEVCIVVKCNNLLLSSVELKPLLKCNFSIHTLVWSGTQILDLKYIETIHDLFAASQHIVKLICVCVYCTFTKINYLQFLVWRWCVHFLCQFTCAWIKKV